MFSDSPIELFYVSLINSLVNPCLLHHSFVLFAHLKVKLIDLLVISRVIVVGNGKSFLAIVDNLVWSRLVESFGRFLKQICDINHKITWDRVNINPLILNILHLKSPLSPH